jgi:hypothetical protein
MKKKVLIIVAHPDDETIWCGGTILQNKTKWDLTILCFCRKSDLDRAPKFKKVCKLYNAKSIILDFEDDKMNNISMNQYLNELKKFSKQKFDLILTHGKNGEYGHKRHKEVHKAIKQGIKNKILSTRKLFLFSYNKKGKFCYSSASSDRFIKLGPLLFIRKKKIISNYYGFQRGGFEEKSCRNVESFKILNLK